MNRIIPTGAALFMGFAGSAFATDLSAPASRIAPDAGLGFYIAARGGYSGLQFNSLNAINPRVTGIVNNSAGSGLGFGALAIGLRLPSLPVRLELEGTIRDAGRNQIDTVGFCPAAQCGGNINFNGFNAIKVRANTLMLNAFFCDYAITDRFDVFAGVGLGIADVKSSAVQRFTIVQNPGAGVLVGAIWPSKSTQNFAFSGTLGAAYKLTANAAIEAGI